MPAAENAGLTRTVKTQIELPWQTILRVLMTLGFLAFVFATRGVLFQIFIGLLLAAALFPLVWFLEKRGLSRGLSVVFVLIGMLGLIAVIVAAVIPPLIEQATDFWDQTPTYARDSLGFLREREPDVYNRIIIWVDDQTSGATVAEIDVNRAISGGVSVFAFLASAVAAIAVAAFTLTAGEEMLQHAWQASSARAGRENSQALP